MEKKICLLLLTIFCCTKFYSQGPWTHGKNKAFVQTGVSGFFYNKITINNNDTNLPGTISDITTQLYAEYGIADNLDVSLIVPFKTIQSNSKDGLHSNSLTGLSNITLGCKYNFYNKHLKISTGIYFSTNTNHSNDMAALKTGYDASTLLPYLTLGSSHGKIYYFATIGYGYMTNQYTDFVKIGGEIGYNFIKKTHVILNFDVKKAMQVERNFDSIDNKLYQTTALYIDKQQFFAVGIKLNHEIIKNKFGINIGAIGAIYLDNLPIAPSINSGLYLKL